MFKSSLHPLTVVVSAAALWVLASAPGRAIGLDVSSAPPPAIQSASTVTPTPPGGCLSSSNTCVTVPFGIVRGDATGMRAFSVTFTLSSELDLCSGLGSITEGTYLSGVPLSTTTFQVLANGGGSYTVDCAILGLPCGATAATGTLFSVAVKRTVANGTGTITPTIVLLRDCNNVAIPAAAGSPGSIPIDTTPPTAVGNLAATQVKTGNDADGTTKIHLTFTAPGDAATVKVYRAGFGNYPEYDDAPGAGSVPATPSYPPAAPWTLTAVTTSGQNDEVASRDFWYYVVFTLDGCGNVSSVSNQTAGTLNYHLGDTHNGVANCAGNNSVDTADISHLGANYGVTLVASDPRACLDVGPTTDLSVDARPTTDNHIQFEDLILFAINYGTVSKPGAPLAPASQDRLDVLAANHVEPGTDFTARLWATGTGRVQGLSARLRWDSAVVQPIGVAAGDLLESQGGVAFTPAPGVVDLALLGLRPSALAGEGEVASIRFQVIAAGDPRLGLVAVDARDAANHPVAIDIGSPSSATQAAPRVTALLPNVPNPFNPSTKIGFSLAAGGDVDVAIYDAAGRALATLAHDTRGPGVYEVRWDGTDARGVRAPSGVYYVRMVTQGTTRSRAITLVK